MTPIDLLHSPIPPGTSLIEASAGTGKTQTIAGLFLRLLLEVETMGAPLQVDQILVLTYTDAATEELRGRIRGFLLQAWQAFETGRSEDPFLSGLLHRHESARAVLAERLRLSIHCFDLAPIFTIHGFCQRALKDRAFESGSLFDTEVLSDQSSLMQEIADDFWRRNFYQASPVRLAMALEHDLAAESFLPLLRSCVSRPQLRFLSRSDDAPGVIADRLDSTLLEAGRLWRTDHAAIRACFGSNCTWGNKPYNDDSRMQPLFEALERLFGSHDITPRDLAALRMFSQARLREGTTKKFKKNPAKPPTHPFFDRCEQLFRDGEDYVIGLKKAFFAEAQTEMRSRKERAKQLSYDDLLTRLRDALETPGEDLSAELRRRYRAALIDEFQDTDPIQAGIFERIFVPEARGGAALPEHRLYLIGDPKQAIYSFRGADIFSYLQAGRQAQHRYTLAENWRSESGLVRALNTFFARTERPFVFPGIEFEPVTPRGRADETPLSIEGATEPPLQVWFCPRAEGTGEIPKNQAYEFLPRAVAAEISRLLAGRNRIGKEPLRPQDCAVLVMTHHQAQLVQDALAELGIPSVQQTQEGVFTSEEAEQLLRVLLAISHPTFEPGVRAALATRLSGASGNELHGLQNEESAWQHHLERHRHYFEEWNVRGFAAMFRQWASDVQLRTRLLAAPGGERALTNTLHLGELLHQVAVAEKLGPVALTKWFAARVGSTDAATEEYQLRLERDENAVSIVTVHKSKGLQYEIVFAPFCWKESDSDQEILFHHWETGELLRDLGPEIASDHVHQANCERLAENVRLLYVALTRARHRCYLAWGAFKNAGTSAPAWILHQNRGVTIPPAAPGAAALWKLGLVEISDDELRADLFARAQASVDPAGRPTLAVADLPTAPGIPYHPAEDTTRELNFRPFTGSIENAWRVASFSWLTSGQRTETPDHDSDELHPIESAPAASGIFAFPRGSKAGTCLHKILEDVELTQTDPAALERIVHRQLMAHGIEAHHAPGVVMAVQRTLGASLGRNGLEFRLDQVPPSSRLTELEFCFALNPVDPAGLTRLFSELDLPAWASKWPERIGQLIFSPTRGYMKGFIDLVAEQDGRYYLVDWKSNWLGNRLSDYHPDAIRREMVSRFYLLQYHLYAVALHRYLELRLPGYEYARHFGGVRYLFLRGIDPSEPDHGIFAECPPETHITRLAATLLAPAEETL